MNEIIYNIKITLGFILITSFIIYWNIKLENDSKFHSSDFEQLTNNFKISTGTIVLNNTGTIYLIPNNKSQAIYNCLKDIPSECIGSNNNKSIKCLSKLKEKGYGYYNYNYFYPSDKNCR